MPDGGQIRTIHCECGWTCRKQLQEANKLFKLHNRLTHKKSTSVLPKYSYEQGIQGIKNSKHGNPILVPLSGTDINILSNS